MFTSSLIIILLLNIPQFHSFYYYLNTDRWTRGHWNWFSLLLFSRISMSPKKSKIQ